MWCEVLNSGRVFVKQTTYTLNVMALENHFWYCTTEGTVALGGHRATDSCVGGITGCQGLNSWPHI